jgi:hypothetical protein
MGETAYRKERRPGKELHPRVRLQPHEAPHLALKRRKPHRRRLKVGEEYNLHGQPFYFETHTLVKVAE